MCLVTIPTSHAITQAKKEKALLGEKEDIIKYLHQIDSYTPIIEEKNITTNDIFKEVKNDYAIKPDITSTESREERDRLERERQIAATRRNVYTRERPRNTATYARTTNIDSARSSNTYSYGYCTWYAAQKRPDIPNRLGNGGSWYNNAQRNGLPTGQEAKTGAVIVTNESWVGHVGYVESVNENTITITEMNYNGWGKVNTRTIDRNSAKIKGFIY